MEKIRVLVAEDEKLIRQGIIDSIQWEKLGAEVIAEARNGTQALDLLEEKSPEILITDIKMAGGDGLSLIKEAKIILPELYIIIISGYNNFDFAQKAIQLGVQGYLLKPVIIEDLENLLATGIKRIQSESSEKEIKQAIDRKLFRNKQILVDQFYRELVYGAIGKEEIESIAGDYEIPANRSEYCSITLFLEIRESLKWNEVQNRLRDLLAPNCESHSVHIESIILIPNELYHSDVTLIIASDGPMIGEEKLVNLTSNTLGGSRDLTILAHGVGPAVTSLEELPLSYQSGRTQAHFSLISGLNSSDMREFVRMERSFNVVDATRELYEIFHKGDTTKLAKYLGDIENIIHSDIVETKKAELLRNNLVCILSAGDELGITAKELFPDLMVLFRYINLKTSEELIEKIRWACDTILARQKGRSDTLSINMMDRAKEIIVKQFSDPLLSLETIARDLSITPAYFSKLYKEYHRISYIEFLTSLRMERAKELLESDESLKVSAIAVMVGYNSSSYFNYIFKKRFGMTPREYRKGDFTP